MSVKEAADGPDADGRSTFMMMSHDSAPGGEEKRMCLFDSEGTLPALRGPAWERFGPTEEEPCSKMTPEEGVKVSGGRLAGNTWQSMD